ncbi:MAG: hypothetical protein M1821_007062 [Bathelium mastoideum]|nr:MAG: hypothetical protein M1821_007062 [Bathelium mastoideum]
MSERKVLTKYYPPDFDPSLLGRTKGPKREGPKLQPVRLMAPFSMKCTACGEYIYKGRKFNGRKEITDERYYAITIFRFYIRCTRCSAEITFKTDPRNMDYTCERGAKRNFEPWREAKLAEETEEERLDRIQREEEERDPMKELEAKTHDAKTEMAVADALDEIRTRNARLQRAEGQERGEQNVRERIEEERERQDKEDAEAAKKAFDRVAMMDDIEVEGSDAEEESPRVKQKPAMPPPTFTRTVKKKKDFGATLGIKKKAPLV